MRLFGCDVIRVYDSIVNVARFPLHSCHSNAYIKMTRGCRSACLRYFNRYIFANLARGFWASRQKTNNLIINESALGTQTTTNIFFLLYIRNCVCLSLIFLVLLSWAFNFGVLFKHKQSCFLLNFFLTTIFTFA